MGCLRHWPGRRWPAPAHLGQAVAGIALEPGLTHSMNPGHPSPPRPGAERRTQHQQALLAALPCGMAVAQQLQPPARPQHQGHSAITQAIGQRHHLRHVFQHDQRPGPAGSFPVDARCRPHAARHRSAPRTPEEKRQRRSHPRCQMPTELAQPPGNGIDTALGQGRHHAYSHSGRGRSPPLGRQQQRGKPLRASRASMGRTAS